MFIYVVNQGQTITVYIWLVVSNMFFSNFIYGMSSFPLTNISQRGSNHQADISTSSRPEAFYVKPMLRDPLGTWEQ